MNNPVAVAASTAVALNNFADVDGLEEYAEHLGRDDVSIPFIQILQQLSPQCTDGDPLYNPDAKASMFYNTVTGELTESKDKGFDFIPVFYKASYIEWVTRQKGGGFVREYSEDEGKTITVSRNENSQDIIQAGSPLGTAGNELKLTHTHYVFKLKEDGGVEPAVLTMTSTQIKKSKDLNALINNNKIPGKNGLIAVRFAHLIRAKTARKSNDQGTWYVWDFERLGFADAKFAAEAMAFAAGVKSGEKKVDFAAAQSEGATAAPAGASDPDGDVPF